MVFLPAAVIQARKDIHLLPPQPRFNLTAEVAAVMAAVGSVGAADEGFLEWHYDHYAGL